MHNLYNYNKYIINPQIVLKYPKEEIKIIEHGLKKISMNIFMVDEERLPLVYLLNICLLIRIIFNEDIYVKKITKDKYTLNKVHLLVRLKHYECLIF